MSKTLQKLELTRKKTLHAAEQDTDRVKKLRQEFWELIRTFDLNSLVFVDESGTDTWLKSGNPPTPVSS